MLTAAFLLMAALPAALSAQGATQQALVQGITRYEERDPRGAIANLKSLTSRTWPHPITTDQVVRAFVYLGASYAEVHADSAPAFFLAALTFDPFAELQDGSFRGAAHTAFVYARARAGRLGVRPPPSSWLVYTDSAATAFPITLVTTSAAQLRVEVVNATDATQRIVLFDEVSSGQREVRWLGQLASGLDTDSAITLRFRAEARFQEASLPARTEAQCFTVSRPRALQAGRRVVLQVKPYAGAC